MYHSRDTMSRTNAGLSTPRLRRMSQGLESTLLYNPWFVYSISTVEPPRSGFLRSGHLPKPDMIFYEIFTNIIYTSIGENIQHSKKHKKLTIKAGIILVHMSAQCPDLRE